MPSCNSLTPSETIRYSRQILLSELGLAGQQRLKDSRALVIGAGGLGSPASLYLAAAGVGVLGIADFDRVELHNLHRQILHADADVGRPKVESAARRLTALNPEVEIRIHPEGVQPEQALELFRSYDLIVDGTDNFAARYLNNDAAALAGVPLVYGSIFQFEGQVSVFAPNRGGPCYRCLFPEPPPPGEVPNCGEAGVLGALCGVIGSLQAAEAVKLLSGAGEPLIGRLLTLDLLRGSTRSIRLKRDPECPVCGTSPRITSIDPARYASTCLPEPSLPPATMLDENHPPEQVDATTAKELLDRGAALLDVREPFEIQICSIPGSMLVPMREVPQRAAEIPTDRPVLVLCHHGMRSQRVTQWLRQQGYPKAINIAGGIDAWSEQVDPTIARY
jgi:sulfur-carrier protein adenylyltransferase/sulfurtransferase